MTQTSRHSEHSEERQNRRKDLEKAIRLVAMNGDVQDKPSSIYTAQKAESVEAERSSYKKWLISALVLTVVSFGAYQSMPSAEREDPSPTASDSTVMLSPIVSLPESRLTASGYVVARRQTNLSAQVPGKISGLFVKEGDVVNKGQLLATIDQGLARITIEELEAEKDKALAELDLIATQIENASVELERYQALSAEGFATTKDLNAARSKVDVLNIRRQQAASNVEVKMAKLRSAEVHKSMYEIRAPFGATVARVDAIKGVFALASLNESAIGRGGLFTLVDLSSLEVEVDIAETHLSRVKRGDAVSVSLTAFPELEHEGRVVSILPIADRSRATFKVRIGFKELVANLLPEMVASVKFYPKST